MSLIRPNFFIVGAPKCGTTAMNDYLQQHPEIFMALKEQHFFGKDLKYKTRTTAQQYQNSFSAHTNEKIIGESSVWYLFSKSAAKEIKEFSPGAKILIMLRNPADMIYSLHSQNIYDCNEDEPSFEKALMLEEQRKKGLSLPAKHYFTDCLFYTDSGKYYNQVKRYLDIFGTDKVMILLYDDLKNDTALAFKKTLEFLNVDTSFAPDFEIINANKTFRNKVIHNLLKTPGEKQRKLIRKIFPFKNLRAKAMHFMEKKNTVVDERKKMNEAIKIKLSETFKNDIDNLSSLIKRDLKHWQQQ